MKRVIGWIINHIPRPLMQRVAGWMVPIIGLLYLGKGKECPICKARRRKFIPYGYTTQRENALCPNCLSLERHRLMWLYITRESNLLAELPSLIHIAPEVSISKRLQKAYKSASKAADYVTADLESPLATMHFDVQQIPLADNSFEVVICNHLLEHVNSDIAAMAELYRIMKPNGWGILLSPVEYDRATTYEDDTITDPNERTRIFGQYDHRRIYGRDYAERLRSVGFSVEEIDYNQELTPEEVNLYALTREIIYVVRKITQ
ncbi:MAG: methyltransferase domain-containing protein [Rikenellaceae bacterium]